MPRLDLNLGKGNVMQRIALPVLIALLSPVPTQAAIEARIVSTGHGIGELQYSGAAPATPLTLDLGNSKAAVNYGYAALKAGVEGSNTDAFAEVIWSDAFRISTPADVTNIYLSIDFEYSNGFDFVQPPPPEVGSGDASDIYGTLVANGWIDAWEGESFEHVAQLSAATLEDGQTFTSTDGEVDGAMYRLSGTVSTNMWLGFGFNVLCFINNNASTPGTCTSRYRIARAYVSDTYFPLGQTPVPTVRDYTLETRSGFDLINGYAVPEPSSWILMIIGFGAVGCAARRSSVRLQN